jgi:gamma-glutamylcyclotransferase (GGCT)/AIG2-like uncharacterized protein YtfP
MTKLLFVYGTLHPERAPADIADVVSRFEEVGPGSLRGRLYDFGAYPGVVLADEGEAVRGVVFAVPEDAFSSLDAYEGFEPSRPAESLFLRVQTHVLMDRGERLSCWIYVWNGVVQ